MDSAAFSIAVQKAHDILSVADMQWFNKFIDRLADDAMRPTPIGRYEEMIAGAARSNTLKELRASLLDEIAKARSFIASTKED